MIVALQYYEADLERTMSLARLLADLEPVPRADVMLVLICQPETPRTPLVWATITHCRRRFPVEEVVSEYGTTGYPQGCNALWRGIASHFFQRYRMGRSAFPASYLTTTDHAGSLLTLDGGDGVPLHPDWLDRMIELHRKTLQKGKLITGTPYFLGTCPLHINPNAVFELDVFYQTKFLEPVPPNFAFAFDVYHSEEMLTHACLSSAVHTDWHGGGLPASRDLLLERSRQSLWLHGYKDTNLYWLARDHLANRPAPPQLCFYSIEQLRLQESVRRSFETTQENVPAARISR